jgi:hypothetical protein
MDDRIGRLFPAGGPVPPDLVIGRAGDIEEIVRQSREAIHTMLTGPRRIGKTTVCSAVCERLAQEDAVVVDIEVPERTTPRIYSSSSWTAATGSHAQPRRADSCGWRAP